MAANEFSEMKKYKSIQSLSRQLLVTSSRLRIQTFDMRKHTQGAKVQKVSYVPASIMLLNSSVKLFKGTAHTWTLSTKYFLLHACLVFSYRFIWFYVYSYVSWCFYDVPFTFPDVFNNSCLLYPAVTVALYPQHIPLRDNQAHFITKERKSHISLMWNLTTTSQWITMFNFTAFVCLLRSVCVTINFLRNWKRLSCCWC